MSRSGYSDDTDDELAFGRWRAQVKSAMRGKRGQKFFRDLIEALDEMPEKRLITSTLKNHKGDVCALGALCVRRGIDVGESDDGEEAEYDFDAEWTANQLDIAVQLVQEAVYENDECEWEETPERRWSRMRRWAERNVLSPKTAIREFPQPVKGQQ